MRQLLEHSRDYLRDSALLSRIYHETRLRRAKLKSDSPVLVYQMGKVGSRSIADSLHAMPLDCPVFHVHFLNQANIRTAHQRLRGIYGNRYNVNRWCLFESQFLLKHILTGNTQLRPKVISLVRDPIARNISSFFHNLDKFIPNASTLYKKRPADVTDLSAAYLDRFYEHTFPLTWFDDEMKSVFGIDVFSADVSRRYDDSAFVYKADSLELLILKTECIDRIGEPAISEFLQLSDFRLKHANVSRDKIYGCLYQQFTAQVRFSEDYVGTMYESKYARYFYSPAEIRKFRARWAANQ